MTKVALLLFSTLVAFCCVVAFINRGFALPFRPSGTEIGVYCSPDESGHGASAIAYVHKQERDGCYLSRGAIVQSCPDGLSELLDFNAFKDLLWSKHGELAELSFPNKSINDIGMWFLELEDTDDVYFGYRPFIINQAIRKDVTFVNNPTYRKWLAKQWGDRTVFMVMPSAHGTLMIGYSFRGAKGPNACEKNPAAALVTDPRLKALATMQETLFQTYLDRVRRICGGDSIIADQTWLDSPQTPSAFSWN